MLSKDTWSMPYELQLVPPNLYEVSLIYFQRVCGLTSVAMKV